MFQKVASLLTVFLMAVSCVQTENSNSQDADTYSNLGGHTGFAAARAIFLNNCSSCHVYHTLSEEQMIAQGVLKGGDPSASPIYYRLSGSNSGPGPKTMPSGGSLSAADVTQIETWINNVP